MLVNVIRERAGRSVSDEAGFSIILAVVVLAVSSLLMFAAIDAVSDDAQPTRTALDQTRALLAADAGLAAYRQQLNLNSDYWDSCPGINGATGVTSTTSTSGASGAVVAGSTDAGSSEYFTYRDLPASTAPASDPYCDPGDPTATTIEGNSNASGSFRVEVTGSSNNVSRSIVAQFRLQTFLNYVYFTNYEMPDPLVVGGACQTDYESSPVYYWSTPAPSTGTTRNSICGSISFVSADTIQGPLHSNDDLQVCGSPTFGRSGVTPPDQIETPGWYSPSGCISAPTFNDGSGTNQPDENAGTLPMPADDSTLQQIADGNDAALTNGCAAGAGCVFSGPTQLQLDGSSVIVTNASFNAGQASAVTPSNGLIYVENGTGACPPYDASAPAYPTSGACGNATVSNFDPASSDGYTRSLTIAAANDVIINGDITTATSSGQPNDNDFLGLIANDFVRVAHPVAGTCGSNTTSGVYSSLTNPVIDAAILAINHSFIVDNWACGSALGSLTVDGAIAQNFRGPVGTYNGNGNIATGYSKDYVYDLALRSESPPYFLSPVGASWQLVRVTECDNSC